MKTYLVHRTVSFALALVITLGLFGGIDHLAGVQGISGIWAAATAHQAV